MATISKLPKWLINSQIRYMGFLPESLRLQLVMEVIMMFFSIKKNKYSKVKSSMEMSNVKFKLT